MHKCKIASDSQTMYVDWHIYFISNSMLKLKTSRQRRCCNIVHLQRAGGKLTTGSYCRRNDVTVTLYTHGMTVTSFCLHVQ